MAHTMVRLRDLVDNRIRPLLASHGLLADERVVAGRVAGDMLWMVDIDVAPWSSAERLTFTMGWGVHVLGVEEALGDPRTDVGAIDDCLVHGRVGERPGDVDPRWFDVRARPAPLAAVADAALARALGAALEHEVLPALASLRSPADVQRRLHDRLGSRIAFSPGEELCTIRRIAALSAVLGEHVNARHWLDHLERRSAAAMAPGVAAARVELLRQRLAS